MPDRKPLVPSLNTLPGEVRRDHIAFYPALRDAAWLDDELVKPQPSDFYGGSITSHIFGHFKRPPSTLAW